MAEVSIEDHIDQMFGITSLFTKFKWDRLLDLKGYYYPELVQQFYANMDQKQETSDVIHTRVNRVDMVVDEALIARVLSCEAKGIVITQEM